jgi:CO/xanthine dehydrogenase Mo-binding subunit
VIGASVRLRDAVESATGRPFADSYADYAREHGALRIDEKFKGYPDIEFDDETYRGDAYPAYGWGACVAEVNVDLDTGEVVVRDVVSANDIGTVIHPVLAEGQVEGGTLQGVGYATIEEIKLADGRYLNDRLATYLIPTSLDAPRINSILVESAFSGAPHGAKGVGELPMDIPAAAVVAAIHGATGVWVHDLPASPERILAALYGIAPPPPPGISTVTSRSPQEAPSAQDAGTPQQGLDPDPTDYTDAQPMRGPYEE